MAPTPFESEKRPTLLPNKLAPCRFKQELSFSIVAAMSSKMVHRCQHEGVKLGSKKLQTKNTYVGVDMHAKRHKTRTNLSATDTEPVQNQPHSCAPLAPCNHGRHAILPSSRPEDGLSRMGFCAAMERLLDRGRDIIVNQE